AGLDSFLRFTAERASGVALQRKPRSLRALFFGFQGFEQDWILSYVSLRKGPWGWLYKENQDRYALCFLVSKVSSRTGFFPTFHCGKGLGGGFTKKTKIASRSVFSSISKADASIAFALNEKTRYFRIWFSL
ncbi:hypothetical protein, partial [Sediminicola sp. 1XM1-17]|uniref:hypothetical protein n=1 Tax=Sediminicola sp. 1XM1-17 TaxID=3127702 RepID=UPI0030771E35